MVLEYPMKIYRIYLNVFYRTDKSRNKETGGIGIGLTIVKTIVNAHNGTITVESKKNEGTKFTIQLPLG